LARLGYLGIGLQAWISLSIDRLSLGGFFVRHVLDTALRCDVIGFWMLLSDTAINLGIFQYAIGRAADGALSFRVFLRLCFCLCFPSPFAKKALDFRVSEYLDLFVRESTLHPIRIISQPVIIIFFITCGFVPGLRCWIRVFRFLVANDKMLGLEGAEVFLKAESLVSSVKRGQERRRYIRMRP
jgi:hypothetical protein